MKFASQQHRCALWSALATSCYRSCNVVPVDEVKAIRARGRLRRAQRCRGGRDRNNWHGVWQLEQFPFRADCMAAATSAIDFLKHIDRALDRLDFEAMRAAQTRQDAVAALNLARTALFGA